MQQKSLRALLLFVGFDQFSGRTSLVADSGAIQAGSYLLCHAGLDPVSMRPEVMDPGSSPGVTGWGPGVTGHLVSCRKLGFDSNCF
jgi:hypothetical protein